MLFIQRKFFFFAFTLQNDENMKQFPCKDINNGSAINTGINCLNHRQQGIKKDTVKNSAVEQENVMQKGDTVTAEANNIWQIKVNLTTERKAHRQNMGKQPLLHLPRSCHK